MTDLVDKIKPFFRDHVHAGRSLLFLEETDSTNLLCLRTPVLLEKQGLVVRASRQTWGIGRMGRRWEQGAFRHLFCSFVLHPGDEIKNIPTVTLLTGLSVYRAIKAMGAQDISIKWPNDILISGRKVSGILCQSRRLNEKVVVVAGIGVNVEGDSRQFSDPLHKKATTLSEQGISTSPQVLVEGITLELEQILLRAHSGMISDLIEEWVDCSLCIGKRISFVKDGALRVGKIVSVDDLGALIVKEQVGNISRVISGEIDHEYS